MKKPIDPIDELWERLREELRATGDPRIVGGAERFELYPYYGGSPMKAGFVPAEAAPRSR